MAPMPTLAYHPVSFLLNFCCLNYVLCCLVHALRGPPCSLCTFINDGQRLINDLF
ncbi:hypothetical protein BDQ12DRAFT_678101 [Crucibulum laeve]|uniref:Uncharacterized protein n=1 Tax=Crucibulum laeve TaxID=68775 RepID=A0A5C3M9F6_9AGAR|nr:hypothetical protein BDQ12DRAFT_678101 [Crucibulum laeve]